MFRTLSAVFDVHFPCRFSENWACKEEKEKLLCNHHVISVVCTAVIGHSSWPNRSAIVKYVYLSLCPNVITCRRLYVTIIVIYIQGLHAPSQTH